MNHDAAFTELADVDVIQIDGGDFLDDLKEAWNNFAEGMYYDYGVRWIIP
jgi:hypothetical protein